ncbi:MAG: hypothetical protein C4297_04530 [Gemmataceae bacterium]
MAFFQAVRAVLGKRAPGEARPEEAIHCRNSSARVGTSKTLASSPFLVNSPGSSRAGNGLWSSLRKATRRAASSP